MSADMQSTGDQMEAAAPVTNDVSQSNHLEQSQEQNVPVSALKAEREQRQQLQDELKMIKEHLALLQSNQTQASPQKPKDDFEGLDDGDVLTVGDFKKIAGKFQHQQQISIEELKMTQRYPDYQEVISKYLPEVLKTNPGLKRSLQQTQDYELAYYLAKNSDSYKESNKKKRKSEEAERIIENLAQPGTLSSVGSTSPISQARRYKEMKDDEFRELMNQNLGVI